AGRGAFRRGNRSGCGPADADPPRPLSPRTAARAVVRPGAGGTRPACVARPASPRPRRSVEWNRCGTRGWCPPYCRHGRRVTGTRSGRPLTRVKDAACAAHGSWRPPALAGALSPRRFPCSSNCPARPALPPSPTRCGRSARRRSSPSTRRVDAWTWYPAPAARPSWQRCARPAWPPNPRCTNCTSAAAAPAAAVAADRSGRAPITRGGRGLWKDRHRPSGTRAVSDNPLSGEVSNSKLAAVFDSDAAARQAAEAVLAAAGLQAAQVKVVTPGEPDANIRLEPEGQGIWRTIVVAHVKLGILGAVLGAVAFAIMMGAGLPFVTRSPLAAGLVTISFGAVAGLLFGGL